MVLDHSTSLNQEQLAVFEISIFDTLPYYAMIIDIPSDRVLFN